MKRKSPLPAQDPRHCEFPHDDKAEMSVLGAILQSNGALATCLELLCPDDFYRDAHGKVFSVAQELCTRSEPVDLITVTNELRRRGQLEEIGSAAYLTSLIEAVPTAANVPYHAQIVKEKAQARKAQALFLEGYQKAATDDGWRSLLPCVAALSAETRRGEVFRDIGASFLMEAPPVEYLIKPIIGPGNIVILAGRWGLRKTWHVWDLALAGITGQMAWGVFEVPAPLRVTIIDEENPKDMLHRRFIELAQGRGLSATDLAELIPARLHVSVQAGFHFRNAQAMRVLFDEIDHFHPDMVIFETLTRIQRAENENASSEANDLFLDLLRPIARERNVAVLLTHHPRKRAASPALNDPGERIRGSGDIPAFADQIFCLVETNDPDEVLLTHVKTREELRAPDLLFKLIQGEDGGLVLNARPKESKSRASRAMFGAAKVFVTASLEKSERMSREEMIRAAANEGLSETTVKRAIASLIEEGMIAPDTDHRGAPLRLVESL